MPKDLKSTHIRVQKIIASGSDQKPWLLVYPSGTATNDSGGINASSYSGAGTDTWAWISGSIGGNERVVFGGDVYVSGSLNISGSFSTNAAAYTYLTASYVKIPTLTANRVVFADSGKQLSTDSPFGYNDTTNTLTVSYIDADGITGSIETTDGSTPFLTGAGGTAVTYSNSTGQWTISGSGTSGGGTATPAGGAGEVQYNDGSNALTASNAFSFNPTNRRVTIGTASQDASLLVYGSGTFTYVTASIVKVNSLTSGRVPYVGDDDELVDSNSLRFGSAAGALTSSYFYANSGIRDNSLTPGRVLFAGSAKEISDDSGLIYDSAGDVLTASTLYSPNGLRDGTLTSGRVVFVGTNSFLSDDSGFTYNPSTDQLSVDYATVAQSLTASYVRVPNLTGGQVVFPNSSGELSGSSDLSFNPVTGRLTVDGGILSRDDVTVSGSLYISGNIYATEFITNFISSSIIYASGSTKFGDSADDTHQFIGTMTVQGGGQFTYLTSSNLRVPSLTSGRVVFAGTGGEITDDPGFTYNPSTDRLSADYVTVAQSLTASYIRSPQITGSISRTAGGSPFVTGSSGITTSYDDAAGQWTIDGSGAGAQVAGSSGELQFNDGSSALTASSALSFNPVTKALSVGTNTVDASLRVYGSGTFSYVTSSIVKVTSLTSGRVVFVGSDDELTDDANLVYDAANNVLTASTVYAATGLRDGSLTAGRVVLAGSDGNLADDSGLTYDSGNNRLSFTFGTVSQSLTASYIRSPQITGSISKTAGGTDFLTGAGGTAVTYNNSSGQWTISGSGGSPGGSDTQIQFNDGGFFGGSSGLTYNKTTGAITGSYVVASTGFTGSLTKLTDGSDYLRAGSNVSLATGSDGSVTISSTGTGGGSGADASASFVVISSTGSLANERVLTAGEGISIADSGPGGNVTIALSGLTVTASAYSGYCTGSLQWSSTTWADFHTVPTSFTDSLQSGISRSSSTFTVTSGGLYYFQSDFNHYNYGSYTAWRLSGSNGTIIQQTHFAGASPDGNGGTLSGIFTMAAGDSFKLQYAYKPSDGSTDTWLTYDPIDGEDMRTGVINIFRIADPFKYSSGSEPGGTDTQVQFNDGGTLGGDAGFTYNKTANALSSSFVVATTGFSGSLTKLTDGSSYLIGTGSTSISTGSNGSVTISTPVYVLNESVSFSQTLGVWYGTLAYAPSPTSSLMLFHNGQLLTQGLFEDYSLSGVTIQMNSSVNVASGDRFFAMYQR